MSLRATLQASAGSGSTEGRALESPGTPPLRRTEVRLNQSSVDESTRKPVSSRARSRRAGEMTRQIRTLTPVAKKLLGIHERARNLTEAWARGMAQGGHEVSPEDYADVYAVSVERVKASR